MLTDLLASVITTINVCEIKTRPGGSKNTIISYLIFKQKAQPHTITQWHADGSIPHEDIKEYVYPKIEDLEIQEDLTRQRSAQHH